MSFVVIQKPSLSQRRREKASLASFRAVEDRRAHEKAVKALLTPEPDADELLEKVQTVDDDGGDKYDQAYRERLAREDEERRLIANSGFSGGITDALYALTSLHQERHIYTISHLLPLIFRLNGKPLTLRQHFPMEPLYNLFKPRRLLVLAGRQIGKSINYSTTGILDCVRIPHYNVTCVTPLFETIRRLSANYVRPLIEESTLAPLWRDPRLVRNVLQRDFYNGSHMFFTFAYLNLSRTRGLPSHKVKYDEIQDMREDFLPVIRASMSASRFGPYEEFFGTPLTTDNTAEQLRQESSQAEFVIHCKSCGHHNVPTLEGGIEAMLGPDYLNREVSEASPGIVCAKCSKPISPREHGHWEHFAPSKRQDFDGYHMPQIIFPDHYSDTEKWCALLASRRGEGNTKPYQFINECLGISYDLGAKLLTLTDLKKASCLPWENDEHVAGDTEKLVVEDHLDNYVNRILSVDWGGDGDGGISSTAISIQGLTPQGQVDVIGGWRSDRPGQHVYEVEKILYLFKKYRCSVIAHDLNGHGAAHQTLLLERGFPRRKLFPIVYDFQPKSELMRQRRPKNRNGGYMYYALDKQRALLLLIHLIKNNGMRFFKFDYKGKQSRGLIYDWLGYVAEIRERINGPKVPLIYRSTKSGPTDFADAVAYGACALFMTAGQWPAMLQFLPTEDTIYGSALLDGESTALEDWNEAD